MLTCRLPLLAGVIVMAALCRLSSAQLMSTLSVDESAAQISFPEGHFRLRLAIVSAVAGASVEVTAELLDLEDAVRSRGEGSCKIAPGRNFCDVEMPPATLHSNHPGTDGDELPHFRVRYSVIEAGAAPVSGVLAVGNIAPELFELHVATPKNVRHGQAYIARVRALHPLTHLPRAGVSLKATLSATSIVKDKQDAILAYEHVVTDADGFASVPFNVPAQADLSSIDLDVEGTVANLHPSTNQTLDIPANSRFELTTDKPLYQPGQTVHSRLLVLDRNSLAEADKKLRVDVLDPDSTLVYRAEATTSAYGIASIDWLVPARMRLGEYTLRAELMGDADDRQTTSTSLRLSRYDLPTFVVAPQSDRPFYLPGSNAVIDVRANYLFGKPVLHGRVRVVREDERVWNFSEQRYDTKESWAISGQLDTEDKFAAHIPLSSDLKKYKAGHASNEFEDLHFAAYVTDASSGRTEQRRFDIRIAAQAIQLYFTGEAQPRGLAQTGYVSATTADGRPVECDLTLSLLPKAENDETLIHRSRRALFLQHVHTDSHGLARINVPAYVELLKRVAELSGDKTSEVLDIDSLDYADEPTLYIAARDKDGRTGSTSQSLPPPTEAFRITTKNAIYRPGDVIDIDIDSAEARAPLTVQLLRHTYQGDITLATREVMMTNGHASLSVPSDNRFSGLVLIHVLGIGAYPHEPGQYNNYNNADPHTNTGSHAILFPRDSSLHVGIQMSAETYAPGAEATASLTVRGPQDADGEDASPAPSALGIVVVDQAVEERNRADNDFGRTNLEPFFFRWRSEYAGSDIAGGFAMRDIEQLDLSKPIPAGAQLAAEVLLAGSSAVFDTDNNAVSTDLVSEFHTVLDGKLQPVRLALMQYLNTHTELPTTAPELAAILEAKQVHILALHDPWGMPYSVISKPESGGSYSIRLMCSGPDKVPGTMDDFQIPLADWHWFAGRQHQLAYAVRAFHARTARFIRSLVDLRDEMQNEGINFDQWRDPWGQPFTYSFSVEQTSFVVKAFSSGDSLHRSHYRTERGPYIVGSASIDYTSELRQSVDEALSRYVTAHLYPVNIGQLNAALRLMSIDLSGLIDPWNKRLYATFRAHSFYTDLVHTEALGTPGSAPQKRTTITPVTEISDIIELRSVGPDGKRSTQDDFTLATFSHTRSTQSAHEPSGVRARHRTVHSGDTGDITGIIEDPSGAVIPGAVVVARNLATGNEYEQTSDGKGRYLIGPIPVGSYKLRIRANGFMDLVYDQVKVSTGNTMTLDAKLNLGSVSESVEVSATALTLNTESASISSIHVSGLSRLAKIAPGITSIGAGSEATSTPRLRDYFPETLLWRPEIITAADGTATLHFPVADNITTWQLSAAASTVKGNIGSGRAEFRAFQPFFAAFDPPSTLTVGDKIALPITLRNYLDHDLTVRSSLTPAPWFRLGGAGPSDAPNVTLVRSQQSASPVFGFTALSAVVNAQQEFQAQGGETGDRISRSVTVHPDGQEAAVAVAGIVGPGHNTLTITLPATTLPGSTDTTLKVYPNLAAHLRDALSAMATYPNGCAEQILSTAWPSLLLQRYAAALPQRDEKLQRETRLHLQEAYENLLANQLASGGFAYWPRDSHADLALTAYAVEFLTQSRAFITIDDDVLARAMSYLSKQQSQAAGLAGLWVRVDREDKAHPEDIHGNAMLTASIAAMIAGAPNSEMLLRKAVAASQPFVEEFDEPYTLANYTLAALVLKDKARSEPAIKRLKAMVLTENGGVYWSLESNTPFFGWGRAGRVEATAQVLRALLVSGATPQDDLIARGLIYLDHEQDRHTLWYSTQATARVLDVLAEIALRASSSTNSGSPGVLVLHVDNQPAITVPLPAAAQAQDAGPIFVSLGAGLEAGLHQVSLNLPNGSQSATVQIVSSFYQPWPKQLLSKTVNTEQLRLAVAFSTTRPQPGKPINVSAHIERVGFQGYGMMIAEIGLPPGSDVDRASLESAVTASGYQINHYEVLPDKILIYLWPRAGGVSLRFRFALRYGVDALAAPSTVYDYYNPDARFDLAPQRFTTR